MTQATKLMLVMSALAKRLKRFEPGDLERTISNILWGYKMSYPDRMYGETGTNQSVAPQMIAHELVHNAAVLAGHGAARHERIVWKMIGFDTIAFWPRYPQKCAHRFTSSSPP